MNTLIIETQYGGHRTEYIENLIKNEKIGSNLIFCVHSKIMDELNIDTSKSTFIQNPFENFKNENKLEILLNNFNSIKILRDLILKMKIDKVIFMNLDIFQFVIFTWSFYKKIKISISGILFEPFNQNPSLNFNYFRKKIQLWLVTKNSNLKSIYVLNDSKAVSNLNKQLKTNKFQKLVDPIVTVNYKKLDIRIKYNLNPDSKIILTIGGVQERKNIINNINAFNLISPELKRNTYFLILGKCFDGILFEKINLLIKSNDNIILINEISSIDLFESSLEDSNMILINYINFYCSSGIFGNAIKHKKPIISSKTGVIGDLTEKFNFGITVDPQNIIEIKNAMEDLLTNKYILGRNTEYVHEHSSLAFYEALIN